MSTRLVATVLARDPDQAADPLLHPPEGADFLELRLDALDDATPAAVKALVGRPRSTPIVATCRATSAGGYFSGDDRDRLALLAAAAEAGAELLDVEDGLLDALPAGLPGERIASCHLSRFLPRLEALTGRIAGRGTRFAKLAVPADTPLQLAELLELQQSLPEGFAIVPTGRLAEAGRVMMACRGAALCYGALDDQHRGHPDQPSMARLHGVFHVSTVTPQTRFYAVVGKPVAHSMSPAYHNTVFRRLGRDARMVTLEIDQLTDLLVMADTLRLDGLSVTHPLKQEALTLAASALPGARVSEAANTLLRTPAGWQARNTDWKAACDLMPRLIKKWRRGHDGQEPRVLLLGSGGAARATAIGLGDEKLSLAIWSRQAAHAASLAEDLEAKPLANLTDVSGDLVVNATPVGMPGIEPEGLSIDKSLFREGAQALDLAYGGPESAFRHAASDAGAQLTTGEDFFVLQARRQAELFSETPIGADVHKDAARRCGATR